MECAFVLYERIHQNHFSHFNYSKLILISLLNTLQWNRIMYCWTIISLWIIVCLNGLFVMIDYSFSSEIPIKNLHGNSIGRYIESHALLIGVSDYQDNFRAVPNAIKAIDSFSQILLQEDFHIIKCINPTGTELKDTIKQFLETYGLRKEDRLLIHFIGQGYTPKLSQKAYLVPIDAPDPITQFQEFEKTALPITDLLKQLNSVACNHTLLLFDSCFSDEALIKVSRSSIPQDVTPAILEKVQEFIIAGMAENKLPDERYFTQTLIEGIAGKADMNRDQYISGTELAIYVNNIIISSNIKLTPRYGKISGDGDFIFQAVSFGTFSVQESDVKYKSTLSVESKPDAAVYIDGWKIGDTPMSNYLINPGKYKVWVKTDGFIPYQQWLMVDFEKKYHISANLNKSKIPKSMVVINTVPVDASIRILSHHMEFSQGMAFEPDRYQFEIKSKGYEPTTMWLNINGKHDINLDIELDKLPEVPGIYENSIGMKFVLIFPDSFDMGSPEDEKGRDKDEFLHEVTLNKQFYMGLTEVTQGQWKRVMGINPSFFWNCGSDCPVENVSFEDCQKFIKELNRMEKTNRYRLPTEAEWEFAARAGSQNALNTGPMTIAGWNKSPELDEVGWYIGNNCIEFATRWPANESECIQSGTHPVALKKPNIWGLYDMHGNVYEWCFDIYHKDAYKAVPLINPIYLEQGEGRVVRGGSWTHYPWLCRSANRDYFLEANGSNYIGLRLVRDP